MRPIYFIDLSRLEMLTHLTCCALSVARLLEQLNEASSFCSWAEEARTKLLVCLLGFCVSPRIMCLSNLENELMVTRREGWTEGIVREFGIDMYILLYLKQKTSKVLL